jgi:hypothetical protein
MNFSNCDSNLDTHGPLAPTQARKMVAESKQLEKQLGEVRDRIGSYKYIVTLCLLLFLYILFTVYFTKFSQ